jgi:hypothetical protein
MKKIMIGLLGAGAVIFAGAQAYVAYSTRHTEQRPYEVLRTVGNIEIRWYPPVNMAAYRQEGPMFGGQNGSFRVLAGYIFGGNTKGQSIAMTSPVEMLETGTDNEMRFMMPSNLHMDSLPTPNDSRIRLYTEAGFHAATLTFGGYNSEGLTKKHAKELQDFLEKEGIAFFPDLVILGYNPPFQVFDRKNGVMLRLPAFQKEG